MRQIMSMRKAEAEAGKLPSGSGFRMRLQRGYGSIRYIGGGRRNPYAVHAPAERVVYGGRVRYVRRRAICYVPSWLVGFEVLTAWHTGYYHKGLEKEIAEEASAGLPGNLEELRSYCERIQRYLTGKGPEEKRAYTVREVYERLYEYKYGKYAVRRLAESTVVHGKAIARKLEPLYDRTMDELTIDQLQHFVNGIGLGRTMVSKTLLLFRISRQRLSDPGDKSCGEVFPGRHQDKQQKEQSGIESPKIQRIFFPFSCDLLTCFSVCIYRNHDFCVVLKKL